MAPFKILISGAGITGPAVAHLLRNRDCSMTIIERSPTLRASGQQIDLRNQGVPIMRKMGLESAIRARCVREDGACVLDRATGKKLLNIPMVASGSGKQALSSEFEIMRGDLVDVFYQATVGLENVEYRFGVTIEKFEELSEDKDGSPVKVHFSDGKCEEFDLVIGADGVYSRVRRLMVGGIEEDVKMRKPLGPQICFFTVPAQEGDSKYFTIVPTTKGRMMMTRKDKEDVLRVYFMIRGGRSQGCELEAEIEQANRSGDGQRKKKAWAAFYKDAGWQAERFTKQLLESPLADDIYAAKLEQVIMPPGSWTGLGGRATVVGDAACCVALAQGLGTTVGFVTAYTLAGELARHVIPAKATKLTDTDEQEPRRATSGDLQHALAEYEKKSRVLTDTARGGMPDFVRGLIMPETEWGVWLFQMVAKWVGPVMLWISNLMPTGKPEEEDKKWAWHDYPELESGEQ